ncbi:MAG: TolC family protein [Elusimicrobiota bacterium]
MKSFVTVLILHVLVYRAPLLGADPKASQQAHRDPASTTAAPGAQRASGAPRVPDPREGAQPGPRGSAQEASAKEILEEKYTLASLVEMALKNSELVSAGKSGAEEARYLAIAAKAWPNPQGSFSWGKKTAAGLEGPLIESVLSQPFLFPGKLSLRGAISDLDAEMAGLKARQIEILLIAEVVRLAYEYAVNRQKQNFAEERRRRLDLVKSYLEGHAFVSPQKKAERRVVESRLRSLVAENLEIEAALKASLERLKLYVAWRETPHFHIEVPWFKGERPLDSEVWQTNAQEQNPEFAGQKLLVARVQKEKKLARKEAWPDFEASAFWGRETADETERKAGLGLSLPLPLFNRNRGNILSLEKKLDAQEKLLRFQNKELLSRVRSLVAQIEASRQIIRQYPLSLIADLERDLKEGDDGFRKGQMDLLLFLELDNEIAETFHRAWEVQKLMADQLAELFVLSGQNNMVAGIEGF